MKYTIERLSTADVGEYIALIQYINGETDFLGPSPEDPSPSPMHILSLIKSERQYMFVARNEHGLIGHLGMFWRRGTGLRLKHCMNVGLGVAKDFWGQGIGNALMDAAETKARSLGITRLELEVMEHNTAAIALYKKRGFEVEGTKRNSIKVGDQYINEILMSKLL